MEVAKVDGFSKYLTLPPGDWAQLQPVDMTAELSVALTYYQSTTKLLLNISKESKKFDLCI